MHVYNKTMTTVFCTKPESSATVDLTLTGRLDRRELQEQILKTEIQTAANRSTLGMQPTNLLWHL